ncbi:MAG TPA: PEGA domain-containing protein [Minicystis sp.]|nr:PEGA domain-containing protein [Minicystis sp.]
MAVFSFALAAAWVAPAAAAPSGKDRALARALVAKAKVAAKAKRWADAADLLRKAEELDPEPQTELDLGRALAASGKLVDAQKTLKQLSDAKATTAGARKVHAAAESALVDVEARLPHVTVAPTPGDARVSIDGASVEAGADTPVDPGAHEVAVEADGYERATRSVTLREAQKERVAVTLAKSPAAAAADAAPKEAPASSGPSYAPAIIAFSIGAVGVGVGATFGALAFSSSSDAKKLCKGNTCPPSAADKIDASKRDGNVSTVAFIVGGAGVGAGVLLLLLRPSKKPAAEAQARVAPYVGAGDVGLRGSF